jgi:PAS domain S-box-containing protein
MQECTVKKESILIVEDDYIVAKVIEKNLLDLGYAVAGLAATGEDALVQVGGARPDLVLMDIHLQGEMDGITASEKIRAAFNIPVVFLTAFSDRQTFERALVTAPYGYIIKPFSKNTLSATIKVALNKKLADRKVNDRNFWLDTTMRSLPEGVITVDAAGKIILVNLAAEQMTGWTNNEAYMKPLDTVLTFVDAISGQSFHYYIMPILHEGIIGTIPNDSFVLSKHGIRPLIEESFASPVRNDKGDISGAVIVLYPKTFGQVSRQRTQEPELEDTRAREISIAFEKQKGRMPEPSAPFDATGWYDRGNYLLFLRRYEDAITAYDNAIAMNPMNYQSWYGKGTALEKIDRVADALEAYNKALSIHPRSSRILDAKGVLLKKTGKKAEAERCFELARLYAA